MAHKILEPTTLSDTIYSKRICTDPSRYPIGYELVTTVEKDKELVTKTQDSNIYSVGRYNEQMVKLLFKCEYKEVTHDGWLQWEKSYY